jgi:acylphosphatase
MAESTAVRVLISGRVQGVSFRWYTVDEARRLEVSGWVRNLPDGRVEAHVEGERDAVERLVAWLRTGPPGARVDGLVTQEAPVTGTTGFHIAS